MACIETDMQNTDDDCGLIKIDVFLRDTMTTQSN